MTLPIARPVADRDSPCVDIGRDVILGIMTTIHAGWQDTFDVSPADDEVKITERLREAMRRAANQGTPPWSKRMAILPGTESQSRPGLERPDGRTDIPIFLLKAFGELRDHDPHAIIECKRIAGSSTRLCRDYAREGMDRFRTGKYGSRHAAGFMVGYVLRDGASDAAHGINRWLSGKGRDAELLQASQLLSEHWAWSSRHPRQPPSKASIVLHHALLEFLPQLSEREHQVRQT